MLQILIEFYKDPDGSTKICCVTSTSIKNKQNNNIEEVLNSNEHKIIRKRMLEDKPISNCVSCIQREKYGNSLRQQYNSGLLNEKYEKYILENTNLDGSLKKICVENLDIRFSNKCNFKCRMCGSLFSTTWDKENRPNDQIEETISIDNIEEWFYTNLEYLKGIKFLYFAGGEPLIQDQHYEFLELCIINKLDPDIFYQSNGSVLKYKEWNIFDLWKNFSDVNYCLSLDGLGNMGKFIRSGFKEKVILENIRKIKESKFASISINIAIQAYNVFYLIELLDEIFEKNIVDKFEDILFALVIDAEYYQCKTLPKELKIIAINKIKNSIYYKNYYETLEPIIKNLEEEADPQLWIDLCDYTLQINKKRNTYMSDYFPEVNINERTRLL